MPINFFFPIYVKPLSTKNLSSAQYKQMARSLSTHAPGSVIFHSSREVLLESVSLFLAVLPLHIFDLFLLFLPPTVISLWVFH